MIVRRRGIGAESPSVFEQFGTALGTTLPLGETGLPVWVLVVAGVIASWMLLPGKGSFRRY